MLRSVYPVRGAIPCNWRRFIAVAVRAGILTEGANNDISVECHAIKSSLQHPRLVSTPERLETNAYDATIHVPVDISAWPHSMLLSRGQRNPFRPNPTPNS